MAIRVGHEFAAKLAELSRLDGHARTLQAKRESLVSEIDRSLGMRELDDDVVVWQRYFDELFLGLWLKEAGSEPDSWSTTDSSD